MTSKIQLLKSAIPQIPTHGFTINSFLSSPSTPTASPNESVIRSFFPGRPSEKTSPERSLFRAWDDHQSDLLSNDTQNPSSEFSSEKVDRRFAYERTVSILEKRLLESWNVRSHLSQAFALESSLISLPLPSRGASPDSNDFVERIPKTLSIPTPLPLIKRSVGIVEHGFDLTGFRSSEEIGPEWYSVRSKLIAGFLSAGPAKLHLLSPHLTSPQDSISLFHRITRRDSDSSIVSPEIKQYLDGAREWTEWGGRGWLGILRSWGL